jgi:transposase InsO family protein
MQTEKAHHSVRALCRALAVSPSGFYAWQQRPQSARQRGDHRLRVELHAAHAESGGSYGSPRLQQAVRARGLRVGRNRVIRLMRQAQLVGRPRRRFRVTTIGDPTAAPAPNTLAQAFTVTAPNRVWAGDITAIPTREGWLYLAVLLDLYSRRVVGWALDTSMETRLVLTAWHRAVALRRTAPRLHHSDRGAQYTSGRYQAALRAHRVRCSMSGRGRCYDNAVVESFFRTLKTDLDHRVWSTRAEAVTHVGAYIDGFYNTRRLHSTLGYCSPAQFERRRSAAA